MDPKENLTPNPSPKGEGSNSISEPCKGFEYFSTPFSFRGRVGDGVR